MAFDSNKVYLGKYMWDDLSGKWFISESGNFVRNQSTINKLNAISGRKPSAPVTKAPKVKPESARLKLLKNFDARKFSPGLKFTTSQGHIKSWVRPLTLKGGQNPNMNYAQAKYVDFKGKIQKDRFYGKWGAQVNKVSIKNATVLKGFEQMIRHLQIAVYNIQIQSENFRIFVGRRALKVFQNSFKNQRFYDRGSSHWKGLSSATLAKRAKHGTGSKILIEYGDLRDSLEFFSNKSKAGVVTKRVRANAGHHKKHTICYAGYHNEGVGTYGRSNVPYVQRQFIGFSSYLDPLVDPYMSKMMERYLFDSVFLSKPIANIKY